MNKHKNKTFKPYGFLKQQKAYRKALFIATLSAFVIVGGMALGTNFDLKFNAVQASVNFPERINPEEVKEPSMRDWVLAEFEKNGLNILVADCVIQQESGWNDQKPPSKTNDYGLMQWNIQHIESGLLNMSCAYDYHCAVNKAIEKIKKDTDWGAWYGYRDANCQRFGKTFN